MAKNNIKSLPTEWPSWEPRDGVRRLFDKSNSDWSTKKTSMDVVIAGSVGTGGETRGTWFYGPDTYGIQFTTEDVVMFFGAQFKEVLAGETYGTNTITFNIDIE